jgi:hypothetical protein
VAKRMVRKAIGLMWNSEKDVLEFCEYTVASSSPVPDSRELLKRYMAEELSVVIFPKSAERRDSESTIADPVANEIDPPTRSWDPFSMYIPLFTPRQTTDPPIETIPLIELMAEVLTMTAAPLTVRRLPLMMERREPFAMTRSPLSTTI